MLQTWIRRAGRCVGSIGACVLAACAADEDAASPTGPAETVLEQTIDRGQELLLEELWRAGDESDADGLQFYLIRAADVGGDDETFVLDSGNDRVVVLGAAGEYLRAFGGAGQGPGEFQRAGQLVVRRDTVGVTDGQRLHFFEADGALISTRQIDFDDPEVRRLGGLVASSEGWFVSASGYFRGGTVERPPLLRYYFHRVDASTGDVRPSGLMWSRESIGRAHNGFFWLQPVLSHVPGADTDGRGRFLVADTATYRIDAYAMDGSHLMRIENRVEMSPIGDDLIDMWKASRSCPGGDEMQVECSSAMDDVTLSLERTEHRPVVARIRAYASGHFSVLRRDLDANPFDSESASDYDHFGPDGHFLGGTSGTIPLWFDGQEMVSLERDSLGVESLVRYRVAPAGGS